MKLWLTPVPSRLALPIVLLAKLAESMCRASPAAAAATCRSSTASPCSAAGLGDGAGAGVRVRSELVAGPRRRTAGRHRPPRSARHSDELLQPLHGQLIESGDRDRVRTAHPPIVLRCPAAGRSAPAAQDAPPGSVPAALCAGAPRRARPGTPRPRASAPTDPRPRGSAREIRTLPGSARGDS